MSDQSNNPAINVPPAPSGDASLINIVAVSVRYVGQTTPTLYTYKALEVSSFLPGTIVIVDVPKKGLCEAVVMKVQPFADLPPVPYEYKWIVMGCSIDTVLFFQEEQAKLQAAAHAVKEASSVPASESSDE